MAKIFVTFYYRDDRVCIKPDEVVAVYEDPWHGRQDYRRTQIYLKGGHKLAVNESLDQVMEALLSGKPSQT